MINYITWMIIYVCIYMYIYVCACVRVTGLRKTDPNLTFGISRITNLKYLTHCEYLLLGCSHAKFTV